MGVWRKGGSDDGDNGFTKSTIGGSDCNGDGDGARYQGADSYFRSMVSGMTRVCPLTISLQCSDDGDARTSVLHGCCAAATKDRSRDDAHNDGDGYEAANVITRCGYGHECEERTRISG